MTLDEAINYCEELAEKNEKKANSLWNNVEGNPYYEYYTRCAEEHKQLVEYLRELKELREQTNRMER